MFTPSARAFAQQPALLALDEPTASLDLLYQQTLLQQVALRQQQGVAVVSVLHDLNLALRYAERVLVLQAGRVVGLGSPRDVLTPSLIRNVFGVEATVLRHPTEERVYLAV